jgi:hypothetical protein
MITNGFLQNIDSEGIGKPIGRFKLIQGIPNVKSAIAGSFQRDLVKKCAIDFSNLAFF